MKVLLFADGIVGEKIANHLIAIYPDDLFAVATVVPNAITDACSSAGVRTFAFDSEASIISEFTDSEIDLGILAWWPKLIRKPLIDLPRKGFINTHPSLLPYNRGKHYNFWALVEQAPFGVTLHEVNERVDAGGIVAQRAIPYDWTDTAEALYTKAQSAMVELFVEAYPKLRGGDFAAVPQDLSKGSFHRASELDEASHISLDRSYEARVLLNLLRARTFPGHPGCWFEDDGQIYEVRVSITRRQT